MQGLRAAENRRQRLHGHANDVDIGLLGGERGAAGLRVEAQLPRFGIFGAKALAHDRSPQATRGAEFGDFFQEIVVGIEEKRQPVSYTHLRAHETVLDLVCRLLLEKKNQTHNISLENMRHRKL